MNAAAAAVAEDMALEQIIAIPTLLASVPQLETDHFAQFSHKLVFGVIRNLEASGAEISTTKITKCIEAEGKLEAPGVLPLMGRLAAVPERPAAWREQRLIETVIVLEAQRARTAATAFSADWADGAEPMPAMPPPDTPVRRSRTFAELVDLIYARKDMPWIPLFVGAVEVGTLRAGSFVALIAPSGAGKSSLALQMLCDHAIDRGPAIYFTHELDGDEAAARALGQRCGYSWKAVLLGKVPIGLVPNIERLRFLDRDNATPAALTQTVDELRALFPDQPILVAVDYLQATPAPEGQQRSHVSGISTELRMSAKRLGVVIMGVSQMSNANSAAARRGEKIGADAADTGAETAQIQRDSYLILTLGDEQPIEDNGRAWKLSIAKNRMGVGDQIVTVHYNGRIGTWQVVGEMRPSAEVRAERVTDNTNAAVETYKLAMAQLVSKASQPLTRGAVRAGIGVKGRTTDKVRALDELVANGELVEICGRGKAKPVWVRVKAEAQGLQIREVGL